MNTDAFLDQLRAVLLEHHRDFRAQALAAVDGGWELRLAHDSASAVQCLQQAIKEPSLAGLLSSWHGGDLLVTVQGQGYLAAVPVVLVRLGSLHLVSQSQPRPDREEPSGEFAAWFEELIGAPPPIAFELESLKADFWGTPNTRGRSIVGFYQLPRIEDLDGYTLVGFSGYGSNSYALYVTRVSGDARMFLRLPWGGAYMDPERERPRLLESLREANRLFELAAARRLPLFLNNNMSEWYFAPRSLERFSDEETKWMLNLDEVREYVEGAQGHR